MRAKEFITETENYLYHGSDSPVIQGPLRTGERDDGWFGPGFYLTASLDYAKRWGRYIYKMTAPPGKYAEVQVIGNYEKTMYDDISQKANEYAGGKDAWIQNELLWAQKFQEFLVKNGVIGVRAHFDNEKDVEVVVFNPASVKRESDHPFLDQKQTQQAN